MTSASRRPPSRERRFGAVVPDEYRPWRPPQPASDGRPSVRRRPPASRPSPPAPAWGRITAVEIEEVARQAADRRAARLASRRSFLGRHRLSAPRRPQALDALLDAGRVPKALAALTLVLVLAAAAVLALPWLRVQRVEVEGSTVVPWPRLLQEAGARLGESTVLLNTSAMTASLLAQPWVRSASVTVSWPGTLVMRVEPLPGVLLYQQGGDQQSLAASGASLGQVPALGAAPRLPLLVDQRDLAEARPGEEVLPARLTAALVALAQAFPAAYGVSVQDYVIAGRGALEIQSSVGWTADLGLAVTPAEISSLGRKLEALRAVSSKVDLRQPGIKEIYLEDPQQVVVSP